jgi:hypothetical protein
MGARASESKWFWVPGLFGALLFVTLILRWLPAASVRARDAYGLGQVIAGDLALAWKSLLRCAVAYGVTTLAIDILPPIRWREVLAVTFAALVAEVLSELAAAAFWGADAGTGVQLAASAVAYSITLATSIAVIRRWSLWS